MAIVEKFKKSFEATKESYIGWVVLNGCIGAAAICALIGVMIWIANYIGPVIACFVVSGLFMLAAGVVKWIIDSKEKEAARRLASAKQEIKQDVAVITTPLQVVRRSASGQTFPFVSLGLLAGLSLLAYYLKEQEAPPT